MLYAEVAVEAGRSLDRETYTYSVPEDIDIVPGHRVTVPFGRRTTYGFVVSLSTDVPGVETKPITTAGNVAMMMSHKSRLASAADRLLCPPRPVSPCARTSQSRQK